MGHTHAAHPAPSTWESFRRDLVGEGHIGQHHHGGGGLLLLLGLLVAVPTFVVELVPWRWQAALVWAGAYILIGLALLMVARSRFQLRLPKRTLDTLKENKEWALRRVKSSGK